MEQLPYERGQNLGKIRTRRATRRSQARVLWEANAIEKPDDFTPSVLNCKVPQVAGAGASVADYPMARSCHPDDKGVFGVGAKGTGAFDPRPISPDGPEGKPFKTHANGYWGGDAAARWHSR